MVKSLSCSEDSIKTITAHEVWDTIRGDRKGECLVLDVRTPEEYTEEHLPGAYLIPLHELDRRSGELDRGKKIITYCRSGKRSMGGAILLCALGFPELYSMEGGIVQWPYEKVKGAPREGEGLFKEVREIKDLLLLAMQLEKASQTFYHQSSQQVVEKTLKQLLQELSLREAAHREKLYHHLKKVWPSAPPSEELKESTRMEGALALPQIATLREEKVSDDTLDILETALANECRAFDLYQRMAMRVSHPLQETFRTLADEERAHIDELSDLLKKGVTGRL
jgi:rhodanese-related sulfurtransferase/rubrerythrin